MLWQFHAPTCTLCLRCLLPVPAGVRMVDVSTIRGGKAPSCSSTPLGVAAAAAPAKASSTWPGVAICMGHERYESSSSASPSPTMPSMRFMALAFALGIHLA